MKRGIALLLTVALVAALGVPAAFAKDGAGRGKGAEKAGKPQTATASDAGSQSAEKPGKPGKPEKAAGKAEKAANKRAEKAARRADKAAKGNKAPGVSGLEAEEPSGSVEPTDSVEPSESVEPTMAPAGPGIANAFSRITANLEKSLAKIAAGKKRQLPPGLVRVWLKFAGWLGVDPSTMPGAEVEPPAEPTSTVEPTGTVEPTSTVEPTGTVEPTSSITPPGGVEPTAAPAL